MTEQERLIRSKALTDVQKILAGADQLSMHRETIRFVELAVIGLKAEDLLKTTRSSNTK